MMLRKLFVLVCICGFAIGFAAQGNTPPEVSLKMPASAKSGQSVKGTVEITFAAGLHGYQNPPSTSDLIPVVVSSGSKEIKLKSVSYPKGKDEIVAGSPKAVRVYEGTIKIPVTITLPKRHGKQQVQLKVSYQQCNAQSCYPPSDVQASASISVK